MVGTSQTAQAAPIDPALQNVGDNPKLPRVLLIGDSISIGYTVPVRTRLQNRANVHRPATNCQGTAMGLAELNRWLGHEKWDVIHFNFGIHDFKYVGSRGELTNTEHGRQMTSLPQYEANLRTLVARLKLTKARLVWCSTTPIVPGTMGFVPQDETRYNAVAARVMQENRIPIDDLYTTALSRLHDIQLFYNVHFTPGGYEFLGDAVARSIQALLPPAPTISGLSKLSGPVDSILLISGFNLTETKTVLFNRTEATNFKVLSPTQVVATVPHLATNGKITVSTHGGTATSAASFTITPAITGFTPTSGPVGTLVSLEGTTLTGAKSVSFNGVEAPVTYGTGSRVQAIVPHAATTGAIRLVTPNGTAISSTHFRVTPQISRFTPSRGSGGTSVTITGTGLSGIKSVDFNGAAAAFKWVSSTAVQAILPATATTGSVRITTASGVAASLGKFLVVPHLTSFSPPAGTIGSAITINGTTLSAVTSVTFNGTRAGFTRLSPTQLRVTVPANATSGRIYISTATDTAVSSAEFAVLPKIITFAPSSARAGATIAIAGTGFNKVLSVSINAQLTRFTVLSSTRINVTVPPKAGTGLVQIVTATGTATSATRFTTLPPIPRRTITPPLATSANPETQTLSRPTISTVTTDLNTSSIHLTFLNEPQPELITNPFLYLVTIDGAPVEVESISYSGGKVTLGLPEGVLKEGMQVIVRWR